MDSTSNRYQTVLNFIFQRKHTAGASEITFERDELIEAAKACNVKVPKNVGDIVYAQRYRTKMHADIIKTQPKGKEWVILGRGKAKYAMRLFFTSCIAPNSNLESIKVPDATPEIISAYALTDEQALLAKVRYNRLLDIFLGTACYSLQNHLRTSVESIGQIEIDEVYIGLDKKGRQFVVPVQAKVKKDKLGVVQNIQDLECCREKFPRLIPRLVSTQFVSSTKIAMFELAVDDDRVVIVDERHYLLVKHSDITDADLKKYGARS